MGESASDEGGVAGSVRNMIKATPACLVIIIRTLNPYERIQFQGLVLLYAAYVTIHLNTHPVDRLGGRRDDV